MEENEKGYLSNTESYVEGLLIENEQLRSKINAAIADCNLALTSDTCGHLELNWIRKIYNVLNENENS